jgi:protein SCO1/2
MYSISVDPARDTPEVLARYRRSFDVGPGWTFLTGKSEDITLIQKKLGIRPPAKGKLSEHDTRMIFGNEKVGSWVKRSPFDDPNILAGLLGSSLSNYARSPATANLKPYGEAEEIKETSKGAYLYRTRCDTCHTIGKGDKLGPDLRGVAAARAPAWLKRWIKEPDKMLAEKDPVALQLKAKYRNLPMPNLSLSDTDVDAILDYMKQQDERVAKEAAH